MLITPHRNVMTLACDYCGQPAELVRGDEVYQQRPDLAVALVWICRPCDAWVGCHLPGTWSTGADGRRRVHDGSEPKGRLADATLRQWKRRAHAAFDALWKTELMTRRQSYAWLAAALGIRSTENCHIGMFDVDQCRATEAAALEFMGSRAQSVKVVKIVRRASRHEEARWWRELEPSAPRGPGPGR